MFGIINLPTFIVAGLLFILTPGADTMYILGRSIAQGKKAGIYSVLGIVTGTIIHITLVAFGLSLIVAKSVLIFNLIKYVGAIYLVWLGIKMILAKPIAAAGPDLTKINSHKVYISGILTNLLNPKVILFFLVFLPQFVKTSEAHNPVPFLILGAILTIPGTIWCLTLAMFAARLSKKLKGNNKISIWLNRITSGVFIGLGLKLALLTKR
jgi:RhtB (resistance to homoserine/threonine) family protein